MKVRVEEDARSRDFEFQGAVEFGRQQDDELEMAPFDVTLQDGAERVILAWSPENRSVSREQLRLEPLPGGSVRTTNLSSKFGIDVAGNSPLEPGQSRELAPPFRLTIGTRVVRVQPPESSSDAGLLPLESVKPGIAMKSVGRSLPPAEGREERFVEWLQETVAAVQSAMCSPQFLQRATEAAVSVCQLDGAWITLRAGDRWSDAPTARFGRSPSGWRPSRRVLAQIAEKRRGVFGPGEDGEGGSLHQVHRVVAAPLVGAQGEVIGVLYGESRLGERRGTRRIGPVETALVEMIACGVSAGLLRQEKERESAMFVDFFGDSLAQQLRGDPELMRGRQEAVTVLYCDIRSSCILTSRLDAQRTEEWIGDVLGELSRCALEEGGVLVDYVGDELLAMWGAPEKQPDHTERAARAAAAMLRSLDDLNRNWAARLGEKMRLSIGLNRGPAHVGNVGSRHKFKYGALGNTVNIGSRVQGLTKYLRCSFLVTGEARPHLGLGFEARRVCRARLVNIRDPVNIFEVAPADPARQQFFEESERALELLEDYQFAAACRRASSLLEQHSDDGPLILLLSRAADAMVRNGDGFDPVWTPPGK